MQLSPGLAFPLLALLGAGQEPDRPLPTPEPAAQLFREAGIEVDLESRTMSFPAFVGVRNELLEYLLVAPHGAAHESLFETPVDVEVLNAALLALGAEPGTNAAWSPKDPPPSEEELAAGVHPWNVRLPEGDGFFLYAGWRAGGEDYLFRVEDLLRNLGTQRSMQRHRWIYLGSRLAMRGSNEVFAAAAEGNLINIAFFQAGNTLVTAAVEDCVDQTVWIPNAWLLPQRGAQVRFVMARERLVSVPERIGALLPEVELDSLEDGR